MSEALARQLVATRFPEVAPQRVELLGVGWDNVAYLFDDARVFRFAQRAFAAQFLKSEAEWLPRLAPHLPAPVPVPRWYGEVPELHPYPFAGYALLTGTTACRAGLDGAGRAALAAPLGAFLRALHGIAVDASDRASAPGDVIGRTDLVRRAPLLLERLDEIGAALDAALAARVRAAVEALATTSPWTADAVWVHGDFYLRHLLIAPGGDLSGVIDWGDLHLGDPALDLSIAWSFLPPSAHGAFRDAYGPIDDATWARARFRGLHYGILLLHYALATGDAALERAARVALAQSA